MKKVLLLSALLILAVSVVAAAPPSPQTTAAARKAILETHTVRAVKFVAPSVVAITATRIFSSPFLNPFPFKGRPAGHKRMYIGTGVIVTKNGYLMTNEHVISRATSIEIELPNGKKYAAKTMAADRDHDLALVKILAPAKMQFTAATLGSSKTLLCGQTAIAIGHPFGLTNTVSRGIVSALNRKIGFGDRKFLHMIQTDAAINPGNSGGPLVNALGEVIGINTAIHRGGPGIGFAIPISFAKKIIQRMLRKHRSKLAYFGLTVRGKAGLVEITSVVPGGPADKSGLRTKDNIVSLNRTKIDSISDFIAFVKKTAPGQQVVVEFQRGNSTNQATLVVEKTTKARARGLFERRLGILLSVGFRNVFNQGAKIQFVRRGSVAHKIGLRAGDIIKQVERWDVSSVQDLAAVAQKLHMSHGFSLLFMVQRGTRAYFVTVPY